MQKISSGKFHIAPPTRFTSVDHLVSTGEQRRRHSKSEHPRGLMVDDQLQLARLYDRKVRRFGTLQDAAGINTYLTIRISDVASVAHQPASLGIFTPRIGGG